MALFNIIARKSNRIEWDKAHQQIKPEKYKYLCFFPIPSSLGVSSDCIGIFANGEHENMLKEVKKELVMILETLWLNDFRVIDLYKGVEITLGSYSQIYNYI